MKRALIAIAVTVASIGTPAFAADMPVKAPPAPVVDWWTGLYVGANGGYSWGRWDSTSSVGIFPPGITGTTASPDVKGWLGGFQAGYNWRINSTWLAGLEGDIQWTGERASSTTGISIPLGDFVTTVTSDVDWKFAWFDTFRGRIGALIDPTTLIYLTGGAALGKFEFSQFTTASISTIGGTVLASATAGSSESTTRWGGAVGAGVEKKFTARWSAKAEFLYLDFGSHTFVTGSGIDTNVKLNDFIARAGVNLKLN